MRWGDPGKKKKKEHYSWNYDKKSGIMEGVLKEQGIKRKLFFLSSSPLSKKSTDWSPSKTSDGRPKCLYLSGSWEEAEAPVSQLSWNLSKVEVQWEVLTTLQTGVSFILLHGEAAEWIEIEEQVMGRHCTTLHAEESYPHISDDRPQSKAARPWN